jgi:hypothetical protein
MKTNDIRNAMKAVIEAANILPAAHENGTTATRPYLDIAIATARREVFPVAGGAADREIGSMAVAIVVSEGTYTRAAYDYADQIAALFPMALRIPFTGGVLTIQGAPDIRPGFNAEAEYRVPVVISYIATAT